MMNGNITTNIRLVMMVEISIIIWTQQIQIKLLKIVMKGQLLFQQMLLIIILIILECLKKTAKIFYKKIMN